MDYYFGTPVAFSSAVALTANTPEAIFVAAANVNGAWLIDASYVSNTGAAFFKSFQWGTTPPTSFNPGNRNILSMDTVFQALVATADTTTLWRGIPLFIPAGNGLWRGSAGNEVAAYATATYRLL